MEELRQRDPMYNPNLSRKDGLFTPRGDAGEEQSFFYRDDAGDSPESGPGAAFR